MCQHWRNRRVSEDMLHDVYDGQLWKFLKEEANLLLMMNVDWFRPFKHIQYSAGVIYLDIQNLPRSIRFKPENLILVSCIPGPKEPKKNINSYLKPLCDHFGKEHGLNVMTFLLVMCMLELLYLIFLVTYQQFVRSVVSMDTKRVKDAQNV